MLNMYLDCMLEITGFWHDDSIDQATKEKIYDIMKRYYTDSYYEVREEKGSTFHKLQSGLNSGDRFTTWYNSLTALCNLYAA